MSKGLRVQVPETSRELGWRVVDLLVAIGRVSPRAGRAGPYIMLLPAVCAVGLLVAGLGILAWRAFHSYDPFTATEGAWSLDQFRSLTNPPTGDLNRSAALRTFFVATTVTGVAVAIALPVAYIAVRVTRRWLRAVILIALLAPFLMGEAPRAFGWSLILGRQGALSGLLELIGIESFGLLGTTAATWVGLLQLSISLATFIVLPAVRRIDPTLERAAQTLGAKPHQVWRLVIVPIAAPGLAAAAAIVFLINVAEYDLPQVVGLGRVPFVSNLIQEIYSQQANVNLGAAFSLVLLALSTLVLLTALGLWVAYRSGVARCQRLREVGG